MKLVINERLKGKRLYREVWKPVVLLDTGEDYTGLYEVSNIGRVRNVKTGKVLKGNKRKDGYVDVTLTKNNKSKRVLIHRLVGYAFVNGYFEGATIDHINTCRTCNIWTNIRWVTQKENNNNPLSKQHLSESNSGEKNGFYGKHHTEENKEYLREKGIERGTKIRCIETGRIFRSFREAERVMKIDKKGIRRCCSGLQDNTKGYHFEYVTEEEVV